MQHKCHNKDRPILFTSNRYPFPKNHTFNKKFNRNRIKESYSCIQNIKMIINNQNISILKKKRLKLDETAEVKRIVL